MRLSERIRTWLRRESADAAQLRDDTTRRLEAELTRRERELNATPEERIDTLTAEMAANDAELDALRRRLGPPGGRS